MVTKFTLTLPDQVAADLERWAISEGRNKTNLGNYLVESAVRHKYPDRYPPADAYEYGLKGSKQIPESESDRILKALIECRDVEPAKLAILAQKLGYGPNALIEIFKKLRGKNGNGITSK